MRDNELRRLLSESNPWWRAASGQDPVGWTASDRLLRDRRQHDLGYRAGILDDLVRGPIGDALTLVRGPRRVGKSVAIRDFVVTMCERPDLDTRQVIHFPCDGLRATDLMRVLSVGRDLTRSVDAMGTRPRVWLLDEIGSVTGWAAALKRSRDNTPFGDDTVIVTSSSWAPEEDVEAQLLAGRSGSGSHSRLRLLSPMSFRDYVIATRSELGLPPILNPVFLQTPEAGDALGELEFDVDAYDLAWQAYLNCGGFPRAVSEQAREGEVGEAYLMDLAAWLRGDTLPDEPATSLPRLLVTLGERMTSPLNRTATSRDLDYTRAVFDRRLQRLQRAFVLLRCPQRDDTGSAVPGAAAKYYLTDPLLARLPGRLRAGLGEPDPSWLTEAVLAATMARAIERSQPGRWVDDDTIGYLRTGSGNEVDLGPVGLPTGTAVELSVPVESKWVEQGWRPEARTIEGRFGRGIVATKSVLDLRHPSWAVPAPLLALMLG